MNSKLPINLPGLLRQHLKDEKHFRVLYQQAGTAAGLIEMTVPGKPRSRLQRYRLTPIGQQWLAATTKETS